MNANLVTIWKGIRARPNVPETSGLSFIKFHIPVENAIGMCEDPDNKPGQLHLKPDLFWNQKTHANKQQQHT
jgi:hypothetical protein